MVSSVIYLYGHSFFHSRPLQAWAFQYLKALPEDVDCLLTTGSSGCSIASAMLALYKGEKELHHHHIKKVNEVTHAPTAGGRGTPVDIVAIVDDFVGTGATIHTLLEAAKKWNFRVSYIVTTCVPTDVRLQLDKPLSEHIITVEAPPLAGAPLLEELDALYKR